MQRTECSALMMSVLGIASVEELFEDIPKKVRTSGLKLPDRVEEADLARALRDMLASNKPVTEWLSFLGAGVYFHHIPAAVRSIVSRSEFLTSYTPYQSEVSQGMLQALFEYQSFIAELTGVDVVNSSMYDASTALGEGVLMSHRISGGTRFLSSKAVNPEKLSVARLYAKGANMEVATVDYDENSGTVDLDDLASKMTDDVSGFYFETPNVFGVFETCWKEIREIVGEKTLIIGANPLALAIVRSPGEMGADIVIGDAQVLGVPMNLGGPSIGVFGCRADHIRKMPGRLIGMTEDAEGTRSFCMTLQTREQHIRRSRATSNICTNQALLAVAVAAHLALLGREGLRTVAMKNLVNMKSLSSEIDSLDGYTAPVFGAPHFNEFVMRSPVSIDRLNEILRKEKIHGGYAIGEWFPELKDCALVTTTEMHTSNDHRRFIEALRVSK
ncbi:MAG: aminomethyl-transferring glycine dehydrogenase subunit GcvPA [Methanobacteriota archaeon]|nr:MAG: aminomethyl-transferring glycine dehydrogenase subunit GcvPA [Euryarchaeota archaeon]